MPDDKMLKYGAYWTELTMQNQSRGSDEWGLESKAVTITTSMRSTNSPHDGISSVFCQ